MSVRIAPGMRALWLSALFVASALGTYLLTRAIDDLVPDPPPPAEAIELHWEVPVELDPAAAVGAADLPAPGTVADPTAPDTTTPGTTAATAVTAVTAVTGDG